MKNPPWAREELILALDLYFRHGRKQLDSAHPEVMALSRFLNGLPIHGQIPRSTDFRNANGVAMKIANFVALDPQYSGTGLRQGGRLDREIWQEFAPEPARLRAAADQIRRTLGVPAERTPAASADLANECLLLDIILSREDGPTVGAKKADSLARTGRLACECCGFDFEEAYGQLGSNFAECHRNGPLASSLEKPLGLAQLSVVCANCHRMLHRSPTIRTASALRQLMSDGPKAGDSATRGRGRSTP